MSADQSKPPPGYTVISDCDQGGTWLEVHLDIADSATTRPEAVAACWDHRARIVDEKIGQVRDEAMNAEAVAAWLHSLPLDQREEAIEKIRNRVCLERYCYSKIEPPPKGIGCCKCYPDS